jgi:hypothetical protein
MKVIADWNPSYWWTGSPIFKRAEADVKAHGVDALPAASPARYFRWAASCAGARSKPPDDYDDLNGYTNAWVRSDDAGACYWAVWGGSARRYGGQPTADLASAEWRAELTKIMSHWVTEKKLDGFLLDAPPDYLAVADQSTAALRRDVIASHVRATIVEPMHALGAAVFAEMYNLQVPTIAKMIDGGRNTDMGGHGAPSVAGFPSKLARMVSAANASGLEALLQATVDPYVRWCGTPRTQPHADGPADVAGLKAAATALLAGYYVVRMGSGRPGCVDHPSPYGPGYGASPPGNEWPGGCPGEWAGASPRLAATLKALPTSAALRPGAPRWPFTLSGTPAAYAALRTTTTGNGDAAIVMLNFAATATTLTLSDGELSAFGVARPQTPTDLVDGGAAPPMAAGRPFAVTVPARGWKVFGVRLDRGLANKIL